MKTSRSILFAVLATAAAALAVVSAAVPSVQALYGGQAPSREDAERVVKIDLRGPGFSGSCTGTLIAPDWVLTAGHCARTATARELRPRAVRLGRRGSRPMRLRGTSFTTHPQFNPSMPQRGHDFALLHLPRPLPRGVPVAFDGEARNRMLAGPHVRVVGYGVTRPDARGPVRLRSAALEWLSPFACFSGDVAGMAQTRACAISSSAGVCPGDSGAPVFVGTGDDTRLVGVVSLALDAAARCRHSMTIFGRSEVARAFAESVMNPTANRSRPSSPNRTPPVTASPATTGPAQQGPVIKPR